MTYYDLYCERLGPGLAAEPINALTNIAFFVAAGFAWRAARGRGPIGMPSYCLIALVIAIGIGSSLFHTFATLWARVLDESPILLFQLLFLWLYMREAIGGSRWLAASGIAAYLGLALYCRQFPQLLNGSLVYAPAVLLTTALGAYHWVMRKPERGLMLAAAATLVVAIFLRTLDAAVCEHFPLGTHFLWHLLVAAVIYLSARALIVARAPAIPR